MRPEDCRRGGVVHPEVVPIDVVSSAAGNLRQVIKNMYSRMADTPDGSGVGLLVELETFVVDTAIKVDGQLWYSHDRVCAHQYRASVTENETTCQTKLAIEPGVEQGSAVDLYSDLLPAIGTDVGPWLECESSRIGMRAKNSEWSR